MNKLVPFFLGAVVYCASAVTTILTFEGNLGGDDITLSYELNDAYAGSSKDTFDASHNTWNAQGTIGEFLVNDISSDLFTGEYAVPSYSANDSRQIIGTANGDVIQAQLYANYTDLSLYYNGEAIESIVISLDLNGLTWGYGGSYVSMADYFADYTGTYNNKSWSSFYIDGQYDNSYYGSIDTVTISQVPEPCTLALLGIGGLAIRRKRS